MHSCDKKRHNYTGCLACIGQHRRHTCVKGTGKTRRAARPEELEQLYAAVRAASPLGFEGPRQTSHTVPEIHKQLPLPRGTATPAPATSIEPLVSLSTRHSTGAALSAATASVGLSSTPAAHTTLRVVGPLGKSGASRPRALALPPLQAPVDRKQCERLMLPSKVRQYMVKSSRRWLATLCV